MVRDSHVEVAMVSEFTFIPLTSFKFRKNINYNIVWLEEILKGEEQREEGHKREEEHK